MQKIVKQVAEAVGLAGAIEIVRRWGGRVLYVPTKVQDGDAMALVLGLDLAQRFVAAFGGRTLQLPDERAALRDQRNAAILLAIAPKEDGGQGLSHEQAGLQYGLTRQQVGNIAKCAGERKAFAGVAADAAPGKSPTDARHPAAALTTD